jgi:hypothetical protein
VINATCSPSAQDLKHKSARAYIKRFDLAVLPLWWITPKGVCACPKGAACSRPAKHPCGPLVPKGVLQATRSVEQVDAWWGLNPDCNIGIDAADLLILDVDLPDGPDNLAAFEAENGTLPPTWMQLTGGGGLQYWYRPVEGLRGSVGKIAQNIDIRAAGNYAVAPLSVHFSGRTYCWSVDHHPAEVPLAEAPGRLVELALKAGSAAKPAAPASYWQALVSQPCLKGYRNDTAAQLAGHLIRRDIDPYVTEALVELWNRALCVPPLDPSEVLAVINSICRREFRRRGG